MNVFSDDLRFPYFHSTPHGFLVLSPDQGSKVKARLGRGGKIWSNPGRLPRGGSEAGKRGDPRQVKVSQMMTLSLQNASLAVSMEMDSGPTPWAKVMEIWLP